MGGNPPFRRFSRLTKSALGGFRMSSLDLGYVLDFLSDLTVNNDRVWFAKHKATYEKARLIFEGFVDELIHRLSAFEDDLTGLTAKDCVMRIYRDIRFSRDKTPYKTWMAALIASGGRKSGRCGYGLLLGPSHTMAAGGFWAPKPEQLAMFRRAVDRNPQTILAIVEAQEFLEIFGALEGEKLAKAPQGYAKDHLAIEILKLKQVYVARSFSHQAVCADDFARDYLLDKLVPSYYNINMKRTCYFLTFPLSSIFASCSSTCFRSASATLGWETCAMISSAVISLKFLIGFFFFIERSYGR
jgi:uncharacterized protein (TIGR02453 family)